jgi:hypothetical protein
MEHKPRADLEMAADLTPIDSRVPISREERLARWVEALERDPRRILRPLHQIEFRMPNERRAIREDNSPLTVAYEDPVLRAEGLASDRLGDAIDFFQLSDHDAHTALCSCHLGSQFEASYAAERVKALLKRSAPSQGGGVFRWIASALLGR